MIIILAQRTLRTLSRPWSLAGKRTLGPWPEPARAAAPPQSKARSADPNLRCFKGAQRVQVPNIQGLWVLGTRDLKYWVLGPSGVL